jgi:hypothetical protein
MRSIPDRANSDAMSSSDVPGRHECDFRGSPGTTEARIWLRSVDPAAIYLSVVTLGEIMKGIALKSRTDPRAAPALTAWLERLRLDYFYREAEQRRRERRRLRLPRPAASRGAPH